MGIILLFIKNFIKCWFMQKLIKNILYNFLIKIDNISLILILFYFPISFIISK